MAPSAVTSCNSTRSERSSSLPDGSQDRVKMRLYCFDHEGGDVVLNVRVTVPASISYADLVFRCNEKYGEACSIKYHPPAYPVPAAHTLKDLVDVKDDEDVQNMMEDFADSGAPMLLLYLFPADVQGMTEEEMQDFDKWISERDGYEAERQEARRDWHHTSRDSSFSECPALSETPVGAAQASHGSLRRVQRARAELALDISSADMATSQDGAATSNRAVGGQAFPPRTQDSWFCLESLQKSLFQDPSHAPAAERLPSHISAFGDASLDVTLPDHISVFGSPGAAWGAAAALRSGEAGAALQPGQWGSEPAYAGSVGQVEGGHGGLADDGNLPLQLPPSPTPIHQVAKSEVKVLGTIGEGAFGEVSLAVCPMFGKVAVKWLKPEKVERHAGSFWQEATLLARLNHPNVLRFFGVVLAQPPADRQVVGIMTEFLSQGSLAHLLKAGSWLSLRRRAELALGAVNGLAYLHAQQIVHFDLKPDNLLLDAARVLKVADFGLSKAKYQAYVSSIRDLRGTLPYMAPELVADPNHVTEKADVWSMGMVLWEMLTLEVPFAKLTPQEIIGGLMRGSLQPPIPDWCEPDWRALLEKCWEVNPAARPSCRDLAALLEQILHCDAVGQA